MHMYIHVHVHAHAHAHAVHILYIASLHLPIYQVRETSNPQTLRQSLAPRTPPSEPRQKGRASRSSKTRSHPGREACRPLPTSSAAPAASADSAVELAAVPADGSRQHLSCAGPARPSAVLFSDGGAPPPPAACGATSASRRDGGKQLPRSQPQRSRRATPYPTSCSTSNEGYLDDMEA